MITHDMMMFCDIPNPTNPHLVRQQDDDEVTKLTGGSDVRETGPGLMQVRPISTRHITPHICSGQSSAADSRTTSRLSSSSQV